MNSNQNKRIEVVDALRGFALMGILLLHSIEHFDFIRKAEFTPDIFKPIDPYVEEIIKFLFSGKAYSVFSLMFGLSFFILMDNNASRGVDFKWRFLWRLVVLLIIGYVVSLIYIGEILSVYALLGIPLVLLFRANKKVLVWLAVLLILQIPTVYNLIVSLLNPDFVFQKSWGKGLWREAIKTFEHGSFADVLAFNSWKGHVAVWSWTYYNGRYLQLFGLFVLGLVLGRIRLFENIEMYKKSIVKSLIVCSISFAVLYSLYLIGPALGLSKTQSGLYKTLTKSYTDIAFTALLVSFFLWLYYSTKSKKLFLSLASFGRMSLTNYVSQQFIGVLFFYGFGFAMFRYFGATLSLIYGILFFVIQLYASKLWLKYFNYGPLEWVWRAFTYFNFRIKMKKETHSVQDYRLVE